MIRFFPHPLSRWTVPGGAVVVPTPDVLCIHNVTGLSPSVSMGHVSPTVADLTHRAPSVTTIQHKDC